MWAQMFCIVAISLMWWQMSQSTDTLLMQQMHFDELFAHYDKLLTDVNRQTNSSSAQAQKTSPADRAQEIA